MLDKFNPQGIILNIGSIFGEIGHPAWSVYSATKAYAPFVGSAGARIKGNGISVLYAAPLLPKRRSTVTRFTRLTANWATAVTPHNLSLYVWYISLRQSRNATASARWNVCSLKSMRFPGMVDKALGKKLAVIQSYTQGTFKGEDK
jgi:short-subunit dehydrogenase